MARNVDDILTLARAGFNAKQIAVLLQDNEPAPAPAPVPAPAPAPAPAPETAENKVDPVAQRLDDIMKLMQSSNILGSQQPKQESVDDVIASIINPNGGE